jgi:hypothetical protein
MRAPLEPCHGGIACGIMPPIPVEEDPCNRAHQAESKGPEVEARGRLLVGIGCAIWQESRHFAGPPNPWSNSHWAGSEGISDASPGRTV